ncbi:hypothetical protein BH23CHL8_BH23CHL8_30500 [soil metagenome]
MPDTFISALPAASAALAAMELAVNDAGTSRKVTVDQLDEVIGLRRVADLELASNASSFPEIVLPSGITFLRGQLFIVGVATSVARLRLGGASIDSGANYHGSSNVSTSVTVVTSTSFNAMNLQHATIASGNELFVDFRIFKPRAASGARMVWNANAISTAVGTAPTNWFGIGGWRNTADLLARLQVLGFTALTGTTAANLGAGSRLQVFGA